MAGRGRAFHWPSPSRSAAAKAGAFSLVYQDGNLAALQQVLATLREILSAIYGINIGDEAIGQAAARYQTRQAIITGRV